MSLYDIDDETGIDEFGVCHKDFSLRDEIEYNFRRAREKEQQQCLMPNKYVGNNVAEKAFIDANETARRQCLEPESQHRYYSQSMKKSILPQPFTTGEIAWNGVKGFAQGVAGSLEHTINSATGGGYDALSDIIDKGGYERRQAELNNLVAQENLQKPLKYLNYLNDTTLNAYAATQLKPFIKMPEYIYNLYKNMK